MLPPDHNDLSSHRAADPTKRLLVFALAALMSLGGFFIWRASTTGLSAPPPVKVAVEPRNPVLDSLVESVKALETSQQQAIDQLQVVQDALHAQQAELRQSSGRIAAVSGKLDALQQSFASIPAATPDAAAPAPAARPKAQATKSKARRHSVRRTTRSKKQRAAGR